MADSVTKVSFLARFVITGRPLEQSWVHSLTSLLITLTFPEILMLKTGSKFRMFYEMTFSTLFKKVQTWEMRSSSRYFSFPQMKNGKCFSNHFRRPSPKANCIRISSTRTLYNFTTLTTDVTLSTRVFEAQTATGSDSFSLLACPHTTTFSLLSIFSPLEMSSMKMWEMVLEREMFSSSCCPRLKNVRA